MPNKDDLIAYGKPLFDEEINSGGDFRRIRLIKYDKGGVFYLEQLNGNVEKLIQVG